MRIVRTRSIPRVDDARLVVDEQRLHEMLHTPAGIRAHDGPRRSLVDHGMKLRRIEAELVRRGYPEPECHHCRLTGDEQYL